MSSGNRTLFDFYQRFTAGNRPKDDLSSLAKDGKYMFSVAGNNFFNLRMDFGPWLQSPPSPGGDIAPLFLTPNTLKNVNIPDLDLSKEEAYGSINQADRCYIDNLGYLVTAISMPGIGSEGTSEEINNDFGKAMLPPKGDVITTSQELEISFLNTEYSIFEYIIYPWLEEVQSKVWLYRNVPFARANIMVDFYDQFNKEIIHTYTYYDCFPLGFTTLDVTQEATTDITRDVSFSFDYMHITKNKIKRPADNPRTEVIAPPPEVIGNVS